MDQLKNLQEYAKGKMKLPPFQPTNGMGKIFRIRAPAAPAQAANSLRVFCEYM
jgi:hypothetical protein